MPAFMTSHHRNSSTLLPYADDSQLAATAPVCPEWKGSRRKTLALCTLLALLSMPGIEAQSEPSRAVAPSNRAPVDPQKAEVVRQIMAVLLGKDAIQHMVSAIMPETRAKLLQDPLTPPALVDEVLKRYSKQLQDLDWSQFYIPVYARNFTWRSCGRLPLITDLPLSRDSLLIDLPWARG